MSDASAWLHATLSLPSPGIRRRQHVDPAVVLGLPLTVVIGLELIGFDLRRVGFLLAFEQLVHRARRHALGAPVLEAEWIDEHQRRKIRREAQRIAHRQHAAHGVPDDDGLLDTDRT